MTNTSSTIVAIVPPEDILNVFEPLFSQQIYERTPHITLAYVGQTTTEEFGQIVTALVETVKDTLQPIRLGFEGAGCFDSGDRKVKFALINGDDLDLWAYQIKQALLENGTHVARQAMIPHLTLDYKEELQTGWEDPVLQACDDLSWICSEVVILRGEDTVRFKIPASDPLLDRN